MQLRIQRNISLRKFSRGAGVSAPQQTPQPRTECREGEPTEHLSEKISGDPVNPGEREGCWKPGRPLKGTAHTLLLAAVGQCQGHTRRHRVVWLQGEGWRDSLQSPVLSAPTEWTTSVTFPGLSPPPHSLSLGSSTSSTSSTLRTPWAPALANCHTAGDSVSGASLGPCCNFS